MRWCWRHFCCHTCRYRTEIAKHQPKSLYWCQCWSIKRTYLFPKL